MSAKTTGPLKPAPTCITEKKKLVHGTVFETDEHAGGSGCKEAFTLNLYVIIRA